MVHKKSHNTMALILEHVQWRINSYQKTLPVSSSRVPLLISTIVSTMDGGLTTCFSDIMLSILLKYFHCFFCCAISTFSAFVFFQFVLLSQFFHFVYDFFDGEFMTLGLKLYLMHEKILNI